MSMCYLIGGGLIVRRRRLFRPLQFSAESKERNEAIKIQSAFAPAIRFSPVIIPRLLLFVSFGTWFPSRSARVGVVWHMAAVRVLYRDRRSRRLRNLLKQEIRREPDDATYLSIVNLFIDRSIRRSSPSHPPLSVSLRWSVSAVAVPDPLDGTEKKTARDYSDGVLE